MKKSVRFFWHSFWAFLNKTIFQAQTVNKSRQRVEQLSRAMPSPVWPDAKLKKSTHFSKSCPKSSHSSGYLKIDFFRLAVKNHHTCDQLLTENKSTRTLKIAQSVHTGAFPIWMTQVWFVFHFSLTHIGLMQNISEFGKVMGSSVTRFLFFDRLMTFSYHRLVVLSS